MDENKQITGNECWKFPLSKTNIQENNCDFWTQTDLEDGGVLWRVNDDKMAPYALTGANSKVVIIQDLSNSPAVNQIDDTGEKIILLQQAEFCSLQPVPQCFSKTDFNFTEAIDVEKEDSEFVDVGMPLPAPVVNLPKEKKKRKGRKMKKVRETKGLTDSSEPESGQESKSRQNEGAESKSKLREDELTQLEDNWEQVADRFKEGCECSSNCFSGLNPEKVFRHRLNIADLTKAEHDMYLMGVILASMQNPDETIKRKGRMRIRTTYSFQGKKVCLMAFLYLEHVTLYQMKRIRKHLQQHGVSPRIHGNHGRNPSNTLPLAIYQHATAFVKKFISQHHIKGATGPARVPTYRLSSEWNCKTVHDEYKTFCQSSEPPQKPMQYSTFTNFFKKQFPYVRFAKQDNSRREKVKVKTKPGKQISSRSLEQNDVRVVNAAVQNETSPTESLPIIYLEHSGHSFTNGFHTLEP